MLRRLRTRIPEALALLLGALLRISMATTFDAVLGYDYNGHWPYVMYVVQHHALPPLAYTAATYHPPLYYLIAATAVTLGFGTGALGWLSAVWGMLRLVVVWIGLERWLRESRLARVVALFTAAVLPTAVHLDGMITNETLSMLFCALAINEAPRAIEAIREGRIRPTAWLGLWLGLALMSKISATVLITSFGLAIAVEVVRRREPVIEALRARWKPLLAGGAIIVAIAGWFFVRNQILYGMPAPTGYEGNVKINQAPYEKIPYFQRRAPGFYVGWDPAVFVHPYWASGYHPTPRFFSVLVATTFSDYYNFAFPARDAKTKMVGSARRPVPELAYDLSCLSVIGGTIIAAFTLFAWARALSAMRSRRPSDPRLVLLIAPLLAVLGQMHFATKYPNDDFGPIKGAYVQFVAPILCGLFGLAVAWMWRRVWARAGAVVALGALVLVSLYTIDCRLPRFGPGASRAAPFMTPGKR